MSAHHELLLGVLHSAAVALEVHFTPVLLKHHVSVHHLGLQLDCDIIGTDGNLPVLQRHSLRFGDHYLFFSLKAPFLRHPVLAKVREEEEEHPLHYWSLKPPTMKTQK